MSYLVTVKDLREGGSTWSIPYDTLPVELAKFVEAKPARVLYESTREGVLGCPAQSEGGLSRKSGIAG